MLPHTLIGITDYEAEPQVSDVMILNKEKYVVERRYHLPEKKGVSRGISGIDSCAMCVTVAYAGDFEILASY